jgi:hypothetical protein
MSTARTTPAQKPLGLTLNNTFWAFSVGIFVLSSDFENSIITQGKKGLHELSEEGLFVRHDGDEGKRGKQISHPLKPRVRDDTLGEM